MRSPLEFSPRAPRARDPERGALGNAVALMRENRRIGRDQHDDRAGRVVGPRRQRDPVRPELAADGGAADRETRTPAVVGLHEHSERVAVAGHPRGRADAALEAVADHSGAAAYRSLLHRAIRGVLERCVHVLGANVHARDVVQHAVVCLAHHGQMPLAGARGVLRRDDGVAHDADRERVRDPDGCRQEAGLAHPFEARQLAVAVEPMRAGEQRQRAGQDDRDAGADFVALDQRGVADPCPVDVRDGVQRARLEVADPDPEIARPRHYETAVSCETRFSLSISRAITSRWISFVPS